MDKSQIIIAKQEELDDMDNEYWANASVEEKVEAITFLRECFYGKEATTGRIQKICTVLKLE